MAYFSEWLALRNGDRKWMVGRSSKKRREGGYVCFFTQKKFTALKREHEKEEAMMAAATETVADHLTEPNPDLAAKRSRTPPGMAFWAGTGPDGATCRGCEKWDSLGYYADCGLLKDSPCAKYRSMMNGTTGGALPHFTPACKYFEPAAKERPLSKS